MCHINFWFSNCIRSKLTNNCSFLCLSQWFMRVNIASWFAVFVVETWKGKQNDWLGGWNEYVFGEMFWLKTTARRHCHCFPHVDSNHPHTNTHQHILQVNGNSIGNMIVTCQRFIKERHENSFTHATCGYMNLLLMRSLIAICESHVMRLLTNYPTIRLQQKPQSTHTAAATSYVFM